MKKILLLLLSALFIISLCGCTAAPSDPQNQFSTLRDQSRLKWHIENNYGKQSYENYYVYEMVAGAEISLLLAQRITKDENMPEYIVHLMSNSMSDWLETSWVEDPIQEFNDLNIVGETTDKRAVYELNVSLGENSEISIYLTLTGKGYIDKVGHYPDNGEYDSSNSFYIGYEFAYNGSGQVEKIAEFYSAKIPEFFEKDHAGDPSEFYEYVYNADNAVRSVAHYFVYNGEVDKDAYNDYQVEYSEDARSIYRMYADDYLETKMALDHYYSEGGYITSASYNEYVRFIEEESEYEDHKTFMFNYLNDGTVHVDVSYG